MITNIQYKKSALFKLTNEGLFLRLWLIANLATLTFAMSNFVALVFLSIVTGIVQALILTWAFGRKWLPWVVLAPLVWFYVSYGTPVLGGSILRLVGYVSQSPLNSLFSAFMLGLVIGLCEFILLRKLVSRAHWWILIHALALSLAGLISPAMFYANFYDSLFVLAPAFVGAGVYSVLTGFGLIWLTRD
jgi:hypothetical protein